MVHDKVRAVRRRVKKARAKRAKRKIEKQQAKEAQKAERDETPAENGDSRRARVREEASATKRELRGLSKDLGLPTAAQKLRSAGSRAGDALDAANPPENPESDLGDLGGGEFDIGVGEGDDLDITAGEGDFDIDLEDL